MSSRIIIWSVTSAVLLAGGIAATKEGWLNGWKMRLGELMASPGSQYSVARFRVDLMDQFNYSRLADRTPLLRVDPEMRHRQDDRDNDAEIAADRRNRLLKARFEPGMRQELRFEPALDQPRDEQH